MSKIRLVKAWGIVSDGRLLPILYTCKTSIPARIAEMYNIIRVEIRPVTPKKKK